HWARMPQVRVIDIDQTGIGDKYVEDGIKRNGFKIRGIKFTNTSKDALAMPLFEAMRAGKIFIPNHGLLKMHIASITKGKTATGLPSYDADHNADGHADLFWHWLWHGIRRHPRWRLACLTRTISRTLSWQTSKQAADLFSPLVPFHNLKFQKS
ncbi:MAG: hypothetical protein RSA21_09565, partial [Akkermansia sp.]